MKRLEIEPKLNEIINSIKNNIAGRNDEIVDFINRIDSIEGPYCIMLDAP